MIFNALFNDNKKPSMLIIKLILICLKLNLTDF